AGALLDRNPLGRWIVYRTARRQVMKRTGGHYPAPLKALEVIRTGLERGQLRAQAARFDAERNTLLLETLLADATIGVQYVFMEPGLQRLVRAHARRRPSSRAISSVLRTPRGRNVDPHADHLHVRIDCPAADVAHGCVR
ncbi:MAG: hypothetical protein K8H88_14525, partial [Sandaracinaceae bacterium]|nr:hypothetical protein [Sandaracinaceae bacterium]